MNCLWPASQIANAVWEVVCKVGECSMEELFRKYANTFSVQLEKISLSEIEQRSINYPIVFLFVGDLVKDALTATKRINEEKWQNSSGILYFHAYQSETIMGENVLSFQLPMEDWDRKYVRRGITERFYQDDHLLMGLNKAFRKLTTKIAEAGKTFGSLKKVNLCVVTAIEDPATILIQEFTLLLKSILQESFRLVEVDLYGLLKESQDGDHFALSTSLGISFLKELDHYQKDGYTFDSDLQLTEDELRLPVIHPPSPLFDMVYVLSDKNEDGLVSQEDSQQNAEIISNLNLLKNRKMMADYHEKMDSYQHQDFKRSMKGHSLEPVYASAGFAKVTRPNKAIALYAASYFFNELLLSIQGESSQPVEKVLSLFELSHASFQKHVSRCLPPAEKIADMKGLMGVSHSYQAVKKMSVREAEAYLYEGGTETFFYHNFEEPVHIHLEELNLRTQIERCLYENVIHHEQYGLYCGFQWTSNTDRSATSVINEINKLLQETKMERFEKATRLEQYYQQMVDQADFKKSYLPFSDKKNNNSFVHYLFEVIYGTKYELLLLEVKEAILNQYRTVLEEHHRLLLRKIKLIDQVQSCLKKAAADSLMDSDDDLDKNIAKYYSEVIKGIMARLKEKRGPHFFSDERFFGDFLMLLEGDNPEALVERLLLVCSHEVLTQSEFHRSFEDELLERANVISDYDSREILSKEDLFKQLYLRLHENAAVQVEVFNYSQENRYEEKYFFGDFYSQFMKFALEKEQETLHCKVGCAHEKKSSGIEKLTLMGGFRLRDLMYYRNGEKYYKAYVENGYEFHSKAEASV